MVWGRCSSIGGDSSWARAEHEVSRVIDVTGVILTPDKIDAQLRKFGDDSSVKAIILHINSPGGGAAASQEIYHEVLRVRQEKHKKVIASIESVGASGAYYIASALRQDLRERRVGGGLDRRHHGVDQLRRPVRWAKLKSCGHPRRRAEGRGRPDPRRHAAGSRPTFNRWSTTCTAQFIHDVATGRHTTDDKIKPLATGQVWTGQQSLPLGLIDKVGGFRVALMDTAKDVGISGEPTMVRPAKHKTRTSCGFLQTTARTCFQPQPGAESAPGILFHVEVS